MASTSKLPSPNTVLAGKAVFDAEMPIWLGRFADPSSPFLKRDDPLYQGATTSSIVWHDLMYGKGATYEHHNSRNSGYTYCLSAEIIADLKVAAAIYAHFPNLIKHSKSGTNGIDPKTVKGRIEDLAKVFSSAIVIARSRYGQSITVLSDISFALLKEAIAQHPGRGAHLKRALKLISDSTIQRNLSRPLQWQLVDIEKGSVAWPKSTDGPGIPTLTDTHFLFVQNQCIQRVLKFKAILGLSIHCTDVLRMPDPGRNLDSDAYAAAVDAYLNGVVKGADLGVVHGIAQLELESFICDAQNAAMMLILLLAGMRSTETKFIFSDALTPEKGYWFIKSKVVKGRAKSAPISDGWLAIDITRDAFDVLAYFCSCTGNKFLFSSPFGRFAKHGRGYALGVLNTKLSRWLQKIDVEGTYADWKFSVHQCRETLVFQLAKQQVGLPFISIQLKHFHSRFFSMPNDVTAGYGKYRAELMASVTGRMAEARENALHDLYGEDAKFAGGGAAAHKARIDTFFAGKGYFGANRVRYIKDLASRGVKVQPTSIGSCTRNFELPITDEEPPCYGDFECDPNCDNHVITERGGQALAARRDHALVQAERETNKEYKVVWIGLARSLGRHIEKLGIGGHHGG